MYWLGRIRSPGLSDFIMSFCLRDEEFHRINVPPTCMAFGIRSELLRWNDSVAILSHGDYIDYEYDLCDRDGWPGPERSWTRLCRLRVGLGWQWFGVWNRQFLMGRRISNVKPKEELFWYYPFGG